MSNKKNRRDKKLRINLQNIKRKKKINKTYFKIDLGVRKTWKICAGTYEQTHVHTNIHTYIFK